MKLVAERSTNWPRRLKHKRALCRFFRIQSYRTHIVRRLEGRLPDVKSRLKKFRAGFAKWRYETLVDVLRHLNPLRELCQHHFTREMFPRVQEEDLIAGVLEACRDVDFWKWCNVALRELFDHLEWLRQWGMVCDHVECEEARKASNYRKHIDCPRN